MVHFINTAKGKLKISDPELYIDNEARRRSGHMTHAMVEYQPGKILAFNSNCSPVRCAGHSAFGWVEYRYSEDNGKTWGQIHELPYAKKEFLDGLRTISVEKIVQCGDGTLVAFALRNSPRLSVCCQPWETPMALRSFDNGRSWGEAYECSPWRGRIYDAKYYNGSIFVLEFCNDAENDFTGNLPEHVYRVFRSDDNGASFYEVSVVAMDTLGRGYGAMIFRPDGSLAVYGYNVKDESHMDMSVSNDLGKTWKKLPPCRVNHGVRNPQIAYMDGIYILHARASECSGFVFYFSEDGQNWSDGLMVSNKKGACHYSNNLVLDAGNGTSKLLVQYSDIYQSSCVNVNHLWVEWV